MIDDLLSKYLDDRNSLSDDEYRTLIRMLQESPELAQKLKSLLVTDDALSRHLSMDRKDFESQVTQRLIDLRDPADMAERVRERISVQGGSAQEQGRWRPSWFQRWGWAAATAAMLLLSVLFYAYTKFSSSGGDIRALSLTAEVGPKSKVILKWKDVFGSEEGFQIERSFDGMIYTEIARVASGVDTYVDSGSQNTTLGYYRVRAFSHSGYSGYSNTASVSMSSRPAISVSARGYVGKGQQSLVAGIAITGTENRKILIRTLGAVMGDAGVSDVLPNPIVQVYKEGKLIARNDNWQEVDPLGEQNGYVCGRSEEIKATGSAPSGTNSHLDSAMIITLPPGLYTAEVLGVGETTGMALVEVFEVK